jgi:kynureninase
MFENSRAFALSLDTTDELKNFRDRFLFPEFEGEKTLYFTGNSLGLQPKGVKEALQLECDEWARWGVEGHFNAKIPWFSYHEDLSTLSAPIVGAHPHEVVVMNQLTVNLHLLLISFYQPRGKRTKILCEYRPFPSDQYAFASQARLHGLDPEKTVVQMVPRAGEANLRTEDILEKIQELKDELAVVCFGGVNYITGQFFDLEKITQAAHEVGAACGFDLAHAAGNIPLKLHEWNADFACWCSYKYLNSGPGGVSGVFVHEAHHRSNLLKLEGWWGHKKSTRFLMPDAFEPETSADAWQLSNAPVLSMAAHRVSLEVFADARMDRLRKKSIQLTAYLEFVLNEVEKNTGQTLRVLTPTDVNARGCQLSVVVSGKQKSFVNELLALGVMADWREPDVIRLAPVPLYNSFEDIWQLGQRLSSALINAQQ